MNKFKVGDVVELKSGNTHRGNLQNTVTSISDCGDWIRFNDEDFGQSYTRFKLVDTSKWHKHHDLIIAWAKGATIEVFDELSKTWYESPSKYGPNFAINGQYRIKPTEPTELEKLEAKYAELGAAIKELKGES